MSIQKLKEKERNKHLNLYVGTSRR